VLIPAWTRFCLRHFSLQAVTLGYSNYAEMSMETKMATNIENVHTMIASLLGKGETKKEFSVTSLNSLSSTL
jgi:Zn-dependent oligopeptidase